MDFDLTFLDTLPYIDHWGARRIERVISADALGGALIGVMLALLIEHPMSAAVRLVRQFFGPVVASISQFLFSLLAVYVVLVLLAHWQDAPDNSGER